MPDEVSMSIKMIFGFLPWILFGVLAHKYPVMSMLTALTVSAVLFLINIRRAKIIEIVGLVFFTLLVLLLIILRQSWLDPYIGLMVNSVLALTAFISLLVGTPFTIQYAKEKVDKKFWNTPEFLKINKMITAVWGLYFVLSAVIGEVDNIIEWNYWWVISASLMIGTILFTMKFPEWYKSRRTAKAPDGAETSAA
jgi:hypothetical protein